MEFGTAYTELNDPDVQRAKLTEQLAGADEEESVFRTLDEDFLNALMVGMPPARTTCPTSCSRQTPIKSSKSGCIMIKLTPNGLAVSSLVAAISALS